ncbi:amino acid racemase [Candidatus Peregrinibacteria bacterium]|nr:amino acid racemase [Candidatus Peregrinibacteria bacterium]
MFIKTIGILGGMGPVASADTYVALTNICQQKYQAVQDSDFPKIILYSCPIQEFDHEGFTEDALQRKVILDKLIAALQTLEKAGAQLVVIDCNTVHYFFDELQKSINIPIVNLIRLTVDYVQAMKYKKVAVLCSQTSRDLNLYAAPLKASGLEVLQTSDAEQEIINEAILAVMGGTVNTHHIAHINELIENYAHAGAECVILGCTEISNIARKLTHQAVLVDSEALAIEKAVLLAKD